MVRPTRAAKETSAATPAKKAVNGSASRKRKSGGGGKKTAGRPAKSTPSKSVAKKAKKEEKSYDVEEVRGYQSTKNGEIKVLIKWENYPEKENSWEPISNVSCAHLLKQFLNNALSNVQDDKDAEGEEEEAA